MEKELGVYDPTFEGRKLDHIQQALRIEHQALGSSGLDHLSLIHEALPEIDFQDISIESSFFTVPTRAPIFISSMTAGHKKAEINLRLAEACSHNSWVMGVGSQRRELFDTEGFKEWKNLRKQFPKVALMGNIGISQLIQAKTDQVKQLAENLEALAMIVHTNPLQEVLQKEGTPQFKGGLEALENLCRQLEIPVILKETGCGISNSTAKKLKNIGLRAVDVSGRGGTHWGRIEGARSEKLSLLAEAAKTYHHWGIPTVESLQQTLSISPDYEIWASGGVRSGLDVAKLLAMGAEKVGIAQPFMVAAQEGSEAVVQLMQRYEYELKIALFCTGSLYLKDLKGKYNG